ncbi:unnamed protein product [Chondrus crispus]|uniref:Uncharacterized protein n=1 Tax=Chondrus crispus TaxID=2769 RepID=R7QDY5_CHOCR|nr:unnamed protein product [Chondrus crispus]CDF36727.1 unnamed protein product [Chondrus crispus]|eukprot:XP_005716546.1 unnamed protein product [Chondrus crispus]
MAGQRGKLAPHVLRQGIPPNREDISLEPFKGPRLSFTHPSIKLCQRGRSPGVIQKAIPPSRHGIPLHLLALPLPPRHEVKQQVLRVQHVQHRAKLGVTRNAFDP